jgi:hypothetical protein
VCEGFAQPVGVGRERCIGTQACRQFRAALLVSRIVVLRKSM